MIAPGQVAVERHLDHRRRDGAGRLHRRGRGGDGIPHRQGGPTRQRHVRRGLFSRRPRLELPAETRRTEDVLADSDKLSELIPDGPK